MRRKLTISPYCFNCKHHIFFEFWSDTFPESGKLTVKCPDCKLATFELELHYELKPRQQSELEKIMNRGASGTKV